MIDEITPRICPECRANMGVSADQIVGPDEMAALRYFGFTIMHQGPVDPRACYECGNHVHLGDGESHGRAGCIHNECIYDDPELADAEPWSPYTTEGAQ